MGDYEHADMDMVYDEIKKINQRIAKLEHLLIPEERLSKEEIKELDSLVADAKKNATPFSKLKK